MTFEPDTTSPPLAASKADLRADTFCSYLARQFMARRGYVADVVPEAQPIAAQSDIALSFTDGMSLTIVAMIDREANPDKAFTITQDELKEIAKVCLKYTGEIQYNKMPVTIQLMEVGVPSADHQSRLSPIKRPSLFAKAVLSAWVIDPVARTVWTTVGWSGRSTRKFIEKLLTSPREEIAIQPPVVEAAKSFPWLTTAMLCTLAAVFALEIVFGVGEWSKMLQPHITTLVAFGGVSRNLVLQSGEWYRIFSAPFLHGDIAHLALNGLSLGLAGYILENIIGRAWLAAIYMVGAVCGSLLSLTLNADNIVSVGASGAVTAMFAAMLIVSFRYPKGAVRTGLQMNAIYVMIPSLLPLSGAGKGATIDYAAHFGGAIGGILVALIALALWSRAQPRPRLQIVASLVALLGLAGAAYSAVPARQQYAVFELNAALMPQTEMPANIADFRTKSAELSSRYPRDPRLRMTYGEVLMRNNDLAGAERELRASLAEEKAWVQIFPPQLAHQARVLLAWVLADTGRLDEAKATAQPVCAAATTGDFRAALDQKKLCAS